MLCSKENWYGKKKLHKNSCQLDCKLKPEPHVHCVQWVQCWATTSWSRPAPAESESVTEPEPGWASDLTWVWRVSVSSGQTADTEIYYPLLHPALSNNTMATGKWWCVTERHCSHFQEILLWCWKSKYQHTRFSLLMKNIHWLSREVISSKLAIRETCGSW